MRTAAAAGYRYYNAIEGALYIPQWDQLALLENGSNVVKMCVPPVRRLLARRHATGGSR